MVLVCPHFADAPVIHCANSSEEDDQTPTDVTHQPSVIERDTNPAPLQNLAAAASGGSNRERRARETRGRKLDLGARSEVDFGRLEETEPNKVKVLPDTHQPPEILLSSWGS